MRKLNWRRASAAMLFLAVCIGLLIVFGSIWCIDEFGFLESNITIRGIGTAILVMIFGFALYNFWKEAKC